MPNWVTNFIELEGDEKRIDELKETIKNDEYGVGTVDFNKIIPMPKELDILCGSSTDRGLKAYKEMVEIYQLGVKRTKEELLNIPEESEKAFLKQRKDIKPEDWENGRQAFRNTLKYGYPTWYEWSCHNWGTKWGACGYSEGIDYKAEPNKLWFQTAWSAPHPILEKLSKEYPDIRFTHEWADEDLGVNCGRKEYHDGDCVDEFYPKEGREALEFAARIWEYDLDDLNLPVNEEEKEECAQGKPDCPLIGVDGNIFNLMGIAARTLRDHGMGEQAQEMSKRIGESGSYDEALGIIGEYVNITSEEEMSMQM